MDFNMRGVMLSALLLVVLVVHATAHTETSNEELQSVEREVIAQLFNKMKNNKLQSIEKEVIAQMLDNEMAYMQPKGPVYVKKGASHEERQAAIREQERRELIQEGRSALLKNKKPTTVLSAEAKVGVEEAFLETTLMNYIGIPGGRTFLFHRPPPGFRLTTPMGQHIVYSTSGYPGDHAEQRTYILQHPKFGAHIWINKTPCEHCSEQLINQWADFKKQKPIFHVASFYYFPEGNVRQNKLLAMQCTAKMMLHGFGFVAWDWDFFKNSIWKEADAIFITHMQHEKFFTAATKRLADELEEIEALAKAHSTPQGRKIAEKWCIK